jgi:hypothetical protein
VVPCAPDSNRQCDGERGGFHLLLSDEPIPLGLLDGALATHLCGSHFQLRAVRLTGRTLTVVSAGWVLAGCWALWTWRAPPCPGLSATDDSLMVMWVMWQPRYDPEGRSSRGLRDPRGDPLAPATCLIV